MLAVQFRVHLLHLTCESLKLRVGVSRTLFHRARPTVQPTGSTWIPFVPPAFYDHRLLDAFSMHALEICMYDSLYRD
jgi:hypothetical protein